MDMGRVTAGIVSQQFSYFQNAGKAVGSADAELLFSVLSFGGNLSYSRPNSGLGRQNGDYVYVGIGLLNLIQIQYLSNNSFGVRTDLPIFDRNSPFISRPRSQRVAESLMLTIMYNYITDTTESRFTVGFGLSIL